MSFAALMLVALGVLVALGPMLAPYSPTEAHGMPFQTPSARHLLGTDFVGRDVLSRVLHGGHRLIVLAATALTASYALGVVIGLTAGMRRRADGWLMRPVDVIIVLPWFLLVAVMAAAVGKGPLAIMCATAIVSTPWVARIVRTATIELMSTGFVEAAQARGESTWRIATRQILPNLRPVLIADAGIRLSATVAVVTASSFLGLGTAQPAPDWALMVAENHSGIGIAPLSVLVPALLITTLVVGVNLLADQVGGSPVGSSATVSQHNRTEHDGGLHMQDVTVTAPGGRRILDEVNLDVAAGGSIALVGPSGAGKTTLALAMLGAVAPGLSLQGTVRLPAAHRRAVGYVPQDPATGLNPALRIETAFREVQRVYGRRGHAEISTALRDVDLPTDRQFRRRYPHQLSGGQQQRVLLAMALIGDPAVVVLDEPTTGLDSATAEVLVATLAKLRAATGATFVVITHDLAAVRCLVDEVVTVRGGRLTSGEPATLTPRPAPARLDPTVEPTLLADHLTIGYGRVPALDGLTLGIGRGECVALVGRSGTGKSTLARCLAGLHRPASGRILLGGVELAPAASARTPDQLRAIALVFQNPRRSLNPRCTVAVELNHALRLVPGMSRDRRASAARRLTELVGLEPALLTRRTGTLSGGQAQRVALARALAPGPRLLICDEITSSLDHDSRDDILDLLRRLTSAGVSVLFISHDEEAVARVAHRVIRVG
ncbi:hypothetical protein BVC93_06815 [Mycobacterium sp. MS1601]|nr:hypothetical protein BVC93_06815 [Mycobacterium sp. MS1601]